MTSFAISQPSRFYRSAAQQEAAFERVRAEYTAKGWTFLGGRHIRATVDSNMQAFAVTLMVYSQADTVIFMPGWVGDRKCRLEHNVCKAYDVNIIDLDALN